MATMWGVASPIGRRVWRARDGQDEHRPALVRRDVQSQADDPNASLLAEGPAVVVVLVDNPSLANCAACANSTGNARLRRHIKSLPLGIWTGQGSVRPARGGRRWRAGRAGKGPGIDALRAVMEPQGENSRQRGSFGALLLLPRCQLHIIPPFGGRRGTQTPPSAPHRKCAARRIQAWRPARRGPGLE